MADESGNHRGSVFRLHVGSALIRKRPKNLSVATWGIGQAAAPETRREEHRLENEVSRYIGRMDILWVPVGDAAGPHSDRAFIEQNAIALLAGLVGPLDRPSGSWLGNHSPHPAIRWSGLWNVNYVRKVYDPRFLPVFRRYVEAARDNKVSQSASIAPREWYLGASANQLVMFTEP